MPSTIKRRFRPPGGDGASKWRGPDHVLGSGPRLRVLGCRGLGLRVWGLGATALRLPLANTPAT